MAADRNRVVLKPAICRHLRASTRSGWRQIASEPCSVLGCAATSDGLSMAGINVVILEDACASQPFDGFSAQEAHAFALARFRYQFGQTMTTEQFTAYARSVTPVRRTGSPAVSQ